MKQQNIVIIAVFVFVMIAFYLVSCQKNNRKEEVIKEEQLKEEVKYYNINLSGEFTRTGTYLIPNDWTLKMLFEYGGIKKEADLKGFNLTDLVEEKDYFIPKKNSDTKDSNLNLININTADVYTLMTLNGIGEVLANNIIEYRSKNLFRSIEEIKNVKGVGNYIYEKIKNYITI